MRVDWNACMGSASCTIVAPQVFRVDWEQRKCVFDPAPLEVLEEHGADPATFSLAGQACPYRAIGLEDAERGGRLFP